MKRRQLLKAAALAALPATATSAQNTTAASRTKTFRWAFNAAETGFDPAQINDLYSNYVVSHVFEPPLQYDFLARPPVLRPRTADGMPNVSPDFREFTVRIKPGIFFADDPAFQGRRRELTAADYVYALKRHYDPRWKSGNLYILESAKILGLSVLRRELIAAKKPFGRGQ